MADPLTIALGGAVALAVAALKEAWSWRSSRQAASAPTSSPTILPPPPQPSHPSLPQIAGECFPLADGQRLERTVGEQAREIRKASDTLIEIKTILELRAQRRRGENGNGGTRESSG